MSTSHPVFSVVLALTLAAPIAGCGSKSSGPDVAAKPEAAQVNQPMQAPQPVQAAQAAPVPVRYNPAAVQPADEYGRAVDGLPANIPQTGSTPPTVAEWNAVQKEVTVRGSSALGCQTKMIREWLKVNCYPNGAKIQPRGVSTKQSGGQQAFVGKFGEITSVVVQVLEGRSYQAKFDWFDETTSTLYSRTLYVNWVQGQRPEFHFDA